MSESRAANHFGLALQELVLRTRLEYSITYSEAIGALEVVKAQLLAECLEEMDDDGQNPDDPDEENWGA
jgi:hypothetical protein